ncbi:hypothetical protein TanjilG_19224 [Lupinus angustifolius]|uniref:Major facilitator superfamily (MFS) profile domain-containing protein n=1 Tax=Lupinus angustifolius TaxID=3871 RepID=A0A1J7IVW8_LUPAN|nr:hypothetical protein TanjilG_19224 [Lupinus angustifolius]
MEDDSNYSTLEIQNVNPTKKLKGGWNAALFIIFMEFAERFAFIGLAGNLVTYLTKELHEPVTEAVKPYRMSTLGMVLPPFSISWVPSSLILILVDSRWGVPFALMTAVFAVGLLSILLGIKRYRKEIPKGSPFTSVAQVFVATFRKWKVKDTRNNYWYGNDDHVGSDNLQSQPKFHASIETTDEYRFFHKAMIIDELDASSKTRNPWRLCSVTQVEEVKLAIRLIPIWISCLMFTVIQSQLSTYFTKQGNTLVRSMGPHFQIPPASLQGVVGIFIIIIIPLYDFYFVPFARKITGHDSGITVLQRIGTGLVLSIINMVISALVEAKRVGVARDHGLLDKPEAVIPMSIWWMLPQYCVFAVADSFTIVGLQELFYSQMPDTMRSLGAAAYMSTVGIGGFVTNAIITIVVAISSRTGGTWLGNNLNRAHLDYFYLVLAGLGALNFCAYLWIANDFVYKKVQVVETSNDES